MAAFDDLFSEFTKGDSSNDSHVDIITFVESPWGLNTQLWPAQRFLLKLFYGVELSKDRAPYKVDDKVFHGIPVHDQFMMECKYQLSEVDFLRYLYNEGRCNVKDQSQLYTELVLAIGRRGSKSAMTAMMSVYEIYKLLNRYSPQEYYRMLDVGLISITAVATSSKQASGLYKVARGYLTKCKFFTPYIAADTEERMTFRTQSDIEQFGPKAKASIELAFRPAVGRSLRGPANIVCIFDEFAHFVTEGQSSAEETYDSATPSTATFKNPRNGEPEGRVISISSPLNRQGMFYQLWQKGMEGKADGRLCIQAPTWEFNPTVSGKYLKKKYNDDPPKFLCEFGAEFSDRFAGWIKRAEDLTQCIDPDLRPKRASYRRIPYFMGVDVGLMGDGTALAVTHLDGDVIELDYCEVRYPGQGEGDWANWEQIDFDAMADWIASVAKKFNLAKGMFDQHYGKALEQALKKRGFGQFEMFNPTKVLNSEHYQRFKLLMIDRKLRLYDYPIPEGEEHCAYINELLELQEQRFSKYLSKVEAPRMSGKHDDLSDAICRAIWLASERAGDAKVVTHGRMGMSHEGISSGLKYNSLKAYRNKKLRSNNYTRQRGK